MIQRNRRTQLRKGKQADEGKRSLGIPSKNLQARDLREAIQVLFGSGTFETLLGNSQVVLREGEVPEGRQILQKNRDRFALPTDTALKLGVGQSILSRLQVQKAQVEVTVWRQHKWNTRRFFVKRHFEGVRRGRGKEGKSLKAAGENGYTRGMPVKSKGTFAFLTMDSLDEFCSDDHLACDPLEALGWSVSFIPWRASQIDWTRYQAVIIRSTWDYQLAPDSFLQLLEEITVAGVPVQNPIEIVRWNMQKTYLQDLCQRGVPTVPTRYFDSFSADTLSSLFADLKAPEIVLKPVVGANADHAYRITVDSLNTLKGQLADSYADRPFMAQPFRPAINREGEYSLFFFDGDYSHAILKRPAAGDFRSQEEHGATIHAVEAEADLLWAAERAMVSLPEVPLYARVDFIRAESGIFEVMEFELIEPSLYLRMDPAAAARFAQALHRRFA